LPMPLSTVAEVAFCDDQRSVADWPRSIVDGSTVKLEITGRAGAGGGGAGCCLGAGGGGGAGPFFLHPSATNNSEMVSRTTPILSLLILKLASIKPLTGVKRKLFVQILILFFPRQASRYGLRWSTA
jgi:hypothetical protein